MKRYEFKVVIFEGNDEFWESLKDKTGCDEMKEVVIEALESSGFRIAHDELEVTLVSFTDHPN